MSTSDVIANQLEYVAKDAVHQFGGYRGKLLLVLLLAATIDQSQFNDLHVASATKSRNYKVLKKSGIRCSIIIQRSKIYEKIMCIIFRKCETNTLRLE